VLASLPVITTWVALVAVTVNMDEVPAMIVAGLAVMPAVGVTDAALN
jgi:Na+/citrate or Na+/malate symporter